MTTFSQSPSRWPRMEAQSDNAARQVQLAYLCSDVPATLCDVIADEFRFQLSSCLASYARKGPGAADTIECAIDLPPQRARFRIGSKPPRIRRPLSASGSRSRGPRSGHLDDCLTQKPAEPFRASSDFRTVSDLLLNRACSLGCRAKTSPASEIPTGCAMIFYPKIHPIPRKKAGHDTNG